MATQKVYLIKKLSLAILKKNPPILHIQAEGQTRTSGYTKVRLTPRVYVKPPADGIYEFDFNANPPTKKSLDVLTDVKASYDWDNFPKTLKGIKVYAETNDKTAKLSGASETIEIVDAEAWVDTQPTQPTPGGTLHVSVDINSNNHGRHYLHRKTPQGINPKILMLEIKVRPLLIYIYNPQRLTYTEGLSKTDQYTSIEIFSGADSLETITDIEIVS